MQYLQLIYSLRNYTEINVVSCVKKDVDLSEHGIVLDLGLSHGWAIVRDEHQLGGTVSDGLDGGLVAHQDLTGTHNEGKFAVDTILTLELYHFFFNYLF
jgi:uncharacterized protein YcfJ